MRNSAREYCTEEGAHDDGAKCLCRRRLRPCLAPTSINDDERRDTGGKFPP
jgi:hypothetical protein